MCKEKEQKFPKEEATATMQILIKNTILGLESMILSGNLINDRWDSTQTTKLDGKLNLHN